MAVPTTQTQEVAAPRPKTGFMPAEQQTLRHLHDRYRQGGDLFSAREMDRLRFIRWLCQMGRIWP